MQNLTNNTAYRQEDREEDREEVCDHIACVSISQTEIQCVDCLRKWIKPDNFKSDVPQLDRD